MNNNQYTGPNFQAPVFMNTDCETPRNQPKFEMTAGFLQPVLAYGQALALWHIFEIAGLAVLQQPEAYETRRRCMNLAARIFEKKLLEHPFSAESLIHFANYVDAFKKPGFIWQKVLENEASCIIPNPPHFEIDLEELRQSFRILFSNYRKLSCAGVLTLSLFLLFFHHVRLAEKSEIVNWDEVVQSVFVRPYCLNYNYGW